MAFDQYAKVIMIGHEGIRVGYEMKQLDRQHLRQLMVALVAPLYATFSDVLEAQEAWEYVAFQTKDGVTYDQDTLYLSLINAPKNGILYKKVEKALGRKEAERLPRDYAIKCGLKSKTYRIKVYDRDILRHQLPGLPTGARFSTGSGISYHIDKPHFKDMYFLHKNVSIVRDFYNCTMPQHKDLDDTDVDYFKGFAVTFDQNTLKILKMKRYFFPQDPQMINFKDK